MSTASQNLSYLSINPINKCGNNYTQDSNLTNPKLNPNPNPNCNSSA